MEGGEEAVRALQVPWHSWHSAGEEGRDDGLGISSHCFHNNFDKAVV